MSGPVVPDTYLRKKKKKKKKIIVFSLFLSLYKLTHKKLPVIVILSTTKHIPVSVRKMDCRESVFGFLVKVTSIG